MHHGMKLFAAVLCALSAGAAYSQSALPKSPAATPGAMSFSYDALHDQVIPSGVQLKPAASGAASVTPTTGMLVVTINITAISHFIRATTYHCSLTAIGGEIDLTNAVISGGIETANGVARWNGVDTLACTLKIPYSWTILPDPATTATRGAALAFGVSAVAPSTGAIQRSTLQVDGIEPLPANGATSTFAFSVVL